MPADLKGKRGKRVKRAIRDLRATRVIKETEARKVIAVKRATREIPE